MKAHKVFNIIMVVFFVTAISVPLIAVNKKQGKISVAENRALANFPDFTSGDGKLNTQFIKEFESWFNDNLGFRDNFVKANTKLQYDLFGRLTRTDTVVGKNNWLYLMYPNMITAYQNLDLPKEEDYKLYKETFNQLDDYLKSKGILFITMVNPDKETIYPEYMPETILKVGEDSRTDLVVNYLNKNTNVDIFSTKKSLLEAKKKSIVYSQNYDLSHWNSSGAFVGYTELMNRIKKYIPEIKILKESDFTIESYTRSSIGFPKLEETDYRWSYNKGYTAIEERGFLNTLNLSNNNIAFRYVNPEDSKLPKALILGDSYIYSFMLPNLAESFSELTFIHWQNASEIKNYINVSNPDIFILQFMEPALHQFNESAIIPSEFFYGYDRYQKLPMIKKPHDGLMWLDSANNHAVLSNDEVVIDKTAQVVRLDGWAVDPNVGYTASTIFLKIGDKYYSGSYGQTRTSVSEYFNNPYLTNSGFTFNVDAEELKRVGSFSFIIISNDKTYQYAPVEYRVVVK